MNDQWFYIQRWAKIRRLKQQEQQLKETKDEPNRSQNTKST